MSDKVQLAVMKAEGHVKGGGFHYMLHPIEMRNDEEAQLFRLIGYVILEVCPADAKKLLEEARAAIRHQVNVVFLTEKASEEKDY